MVFKKDRVRPTAYPFLPFHALRTAQLVSSLIVASIMTYFLRELSANGYSLPWTFILLLAVSTLTTLSLAVTVLLHIRHGLNPYLNLMLNGSLAVLWTVSFSLLAWWSSATLASACAVETWDSSLGQTVCRTYKALFSFALLGLMATLAATALDVHVQRSGTRKGRFQSLALQSGKAGPRELESDVDAELWDTNPNPVALGAVRARSGGYALPEEQFGYADTSYDGAAGQVGRRSVDERL
ncbi:uncharacterized protein M421DRAFT_264261 [Didymella exigua CBS 183.55]|uniref:MARVEL domain-containing protein n=1 Tax=Didymella exigua CBS 183.55 TaxID=1150837 RepID=A0A6A5RBP9_9PLEO|nr:uncharacterized protein M421DRAFT_264261 [Didymella exigua CBS 183.55]KAF1925072.1 hypothetical protein M421DRAFT_264261 [Didymella exigua CBS 183.55]